MAEDPARVDALKSVVARHIDIALKQLEVLEADLGRVMLSEQIGMRRAAATNLVEAKKVMDIFPLEESYVAGPLPTDISDPLVLAFRKTIDITAFELRSKLSRLKSYVTKSSDVAKLSVAAKIVTIINRKLEGHLEGLPEELLLTPRTRRQMVSSDSSLSSASSPTASASASAAAAPASSLSPDLGRVAAHEQRRNSIGKADGPVVIAQPKPNRVVLPKLNMASATTSAKPLPDLPPSSSISPSQSPPPPTSPDSDPPPVTPRSNFFLSRLDSVAGAEGQAQHLPQPPQTPRTREEGKKAAVATADAANIWDEPTDSAANFVVERSADGTILITAGTLNKLIEKLTSPDCPDPSLSPVFLLTYNTFVSPELLLEKLLQRFNVPRPQKELTDEEAAEWRNTVQRPVMSRVVSFMRTWVDAEPEAFSDYMRLTLKKWVPELTALGHAVLADKLTAMPPLRPPAPASEALPPPSPRGIGNSESMLDMSPQDIARHLCLGDYAFLAAIKPREFLTHGWMKAEWCPSISALIQRFNVVSHWVCYLILTLDKPATRAKMYAKWIKVAKSAQHLREYNNFASLMAVIAGLHNSAVVRLKATLREVPKKQLALLEEFESLMRPVSNFKPYRDALAASSLPCVPYLGVFLTDLTFIEDGNPNFVTGALINFRKRRMVADVIMILQRFQGREYSFPKVPAVDAVLTNQLGVTYDMKKLYALEREPRV